MTSDINIITESVSDGMDILDSIFDDVDDELLITKLYYIDDFDDPILKDKLRFPVECLDRNEYPELYIHMAGIYNRVQVYLDMAGGDINKLDAILRQTDDICAFCALYFDVPYVVFDSNGEKRQITGKLYFTPTQLMAYETFKRTDEMLWFQARQSGKSMAVSKIIEFTMFRNDKSTHNVYAESGATLKPLQNNIYNSIAESPHIYDNWVNPKMGNNRTGGTFKKEEIRFGANGSVCNFQTLGVRTKTSDNVRGDTGNAYVDEFPLIPVDIIQQIIMPFRNNPNVDVKLTLIGTPSLKANPNLDEWINEELKSGAKHIKIPCWKTADEGRTSRRAIQKAFRNEGVICPFVEKYGRCIRYDIKSALNNNEHVSENKIKLADEHCKYQCRRSDSLMMELFAEFPRNEGRYFPLNSLKNCLTEYRFILPHDSERDRLNAVRGEVIMSVDLGLSQDLTYITVFEVKNEDRLRLIYADGISPNDDLYNASDDILRRVQEIFKFFNPKTLFIDVTSRIDTVDKLWKNNYIKNGAIPRYKIFTNKTMRKKNGVGIWWTTDSKFEMMDNLRSAIVNCKIDIPLLEKQFVREYIEGFMKIEPRRGTGNSKILIFDSKHTPDIVSSFAMAAMRVHPIKKWGRSETLYKLNYW